MFNNAFENIVINDNKKLCEKYPFLYTDSSYKHTLLDDLPTGWKAAFGRQLADEIYRAITKHSVDLLQSFAILVIKEKYGELRIYWAGTGVNSVDEEISRIVKKYTELSRHTCIKCGDLATHVSTDWISPYCEFCAQKLIDRNIDVVPLEEFYDKFYKERESD